MSDRTANPAGIVPGPFKPVVIGTAGHIDHGKTALIRALTGIDTDRLPEEKRRGITIDLGFASAEIANPDGTSFRVSFIDVPGHARFVRNMLAGAGGIDAVLLVISAEEGIKPQTEEHLAICSLLGIQRGLTALTKVDAVDAVRLRQVQDSVRQYLGKTFLAAAPVVPVSAYTGAGLGVLREELARLAAELPARNADRLMRLPLDRAFVISGFGTVITGTLIAGSLCAGQSLSVEPGGRPVKVRGVQVHSQTASAAEAATRVALNLSRIEVADLQRGDTLVDPGSASAVDTVDAEISLLPGAAPLRNGAKVHFHAFATETVATVSLFDSRTLQPGVPALARLKLHRPVVLLPHDRFVMRQGTPVTTVGGGRVLDAHPVPRLNRKHTTAWLQCLQSASLPEQIALRIARRSTSGISRAQLSSETGLVANAIDRQLTALISEGSVKAAEQIVLSRESFQSACHQVRQDFRRLAEARTEPVRRSELRTQARLGPEVFDLALGVLVQHNELSVDGEQLTLPKTADPSGASQNENSEAARLAEICRAFEVAGLAPPPPNELAIHMGITPAEMRRLVTTLLRQKKLIRLGDDSLCFHQSALTGLKRRILAMKGQTFDVAAFKELTGVSRKYAIPLLEYLDAERLTRKQGNLRLVLDPPLGTR